MEDPVLMSRLAALRHNLKLVSTNLESKTWQSGEADPMARAELGGESSLWRVLAATLNTDIDWLQHEILDVETKLRAAEPGDMAAASDAWVSYSLKLAESQGLLRECLEMIGTLAIRQKDLDHKCLYIADELIGEGLNLGVGGLDYYLLVHGMSDALSKTRARIIRLRFPDWTIWDVPLAMHELGNVVMPRILTGEKDPALAPDRRKLTQFNDKQRDYLIGIDPELSQKLSAGGEGAAEATRWAEGRVRVLLADTFATYMMGPAYAYSAIMLRLSPTAAALRDVPSDAQRAQTILSMLAWMNDNSGLGKINKPYTEDIALLTRGWDEACARCIPTGGLRDNETEYLKRFASSFGSDVSYASLVRSAMYPTDTKNEGWRCAKDWAGAWLKQWKENPGKTLDCPEHPTGKLRDVLNATWLCRAGLADAPEVLNNAHFEIASVGQRLCIAVIASRAGRRVPQSSGAAPAGASK